MNKEKSLFHNLVFKYPATIKEPDIFADLYQGYLSAVFNYCLYRVGNRQVAEDLTADTFEKAWRARRRYQAGQGAFSTWLFTIAGRAVIDWQRQQARRPLVRLRSEQPGQGSSPETRLEESEQQMRLRQLVRSLLPDEQELIALKFGAGMSNRDIAKIVDKSESAVGSALHRAVKKLRKQLEQD